ncbi:MAG: hypothetical protein H7X99_10270 [Saprospiraceae bacterium]|nr:hypothetical protein [Saprospiraceae bacterium]
MIENIVFKIPDFDLNTISLQGKGLKKLLVICCFDDFSEVERITLQKMMTAIKYDFENDIYLLLIEKNAQLSLGLLEIDYTDLLIFGIKPESLGFQIEYKLYELLTFEKSRAMILESIREIKAVPSRSKLLWDKLQEMFSIS